MATTNNGYFVWHEHLTRDPKAAIAFYSDVTGWKTQPFKEGGNDYTMWVGSQGPLGGVMKLPEDAAKAGTPPHWMGDIQVADVDKTCALAKKLGGAIYHEPSDIPTVGRFAVVADPQGAVFAVFTPKDAMQAHEPKEGEFCWNELLTDDSGSAWKFYSELFGWKIEQDMDMGAMGTYRVFGLGGTQFGGMMTKPKGSPMPSMWLHYTETSNLDAAIERATQKGAKIMNGPMDVPGGGRIAQLMDPQGAAFALHQAPRK